MLSNAKCEPNYLLHLMVSYGIQISLQTLLCLFLFLKMFFEPFNLRAQHWNFSYLCLTSTDLMQHFPLAVRLLSTSILYIIELYQSLFLKLLQVFCTAGELFLEQHMDIKRRAQVLYGLQYESQGKYEMAICPQ